MHSLSINKVFLQKLLIIFTLVIAYSFFERHFGFKLNTQLIALIASVYALFLTYKFRKNFVLFISILFTSVYPLTYLIASSLDIPYHYLLKYQVHDYEAIVLLSHLIFNFVVFSNTKASFYSPSAPRMSLRHRHFSFYFLIAMCLMCIFIGIISAWPPVLTSYSVDSNSSPMFEYGLIFLALAIAHWQPLSYKNFKSLKGLFLLCVLFCGITAPLLFGRRGPSLMYFWCLIFIIAFVEKLNFKFIIFVGISAVCMRALALLRGGADITLINFILGANEGVMSNHHGGVIVSSVTYIHFVYHDIWSEWTRLSMFLGTMLSFLPYSINPFQQAFIHRFIIDYATIPGSGGFPFVYGYLWFGYTGVFGLALVIRSILFSKGNGILIKALMIMTIISFPRWYAYTIPVLIKLLLLTLFIGLLYNYVFKKRPPRLQKNT